MPFNISWSNYRKIIKLVKKPTWSEYKFTLRVVLLGLGLLGTVGFTFQLIGSTLQFAHVGAVPRDVAVVITAAMLAITLAVTMYMAKRRGTL